MLENLFRLPPRWGPALAIAALASAASPPFAAAQDTNAQGTSSTVNVPVETSKKGPFPIDDQNPESSVPSPEQAMRRPLDMGFFVMQLLDRGKKATDRGDHAATVKYYRAIAKAMPERATSYSLLCQAYEALGDIPSAVENCRRTLGMSGVTVDDNVRFVGVVLKKEGPLPQSDLEDVQAVIAHLEKELEQDTKNLVLVNGLRCDLATKLDDLQGLEACTAKLREIAPKDPRTVAFMWALLIKKRDFNGAEQLIHDARRYGLPDEALDKMVSGLRAARDPDNAWMKEWLGLALSCAAAVLGAVFAAFYLRRKRAVGASQLSHS